eukprot:4588146-Pyramimonas_sp.AAC.1
MEGGLQDRPVRGPGSAHQVRGADDEGREGRRTDEAGRARRRALAARRGRRSRLEGILRARRAEHQRGRAPRRAEACR